MVDHATAKYLNDNIGTVLAKALAEMSVAQPNNGVDFLAQWLKTYAEQEEAKEARQKAEKTLEEDRAKTRAKLEEKEALSKKALEEAARKAGLYDSLKTMFESADTEFTDELWSKLIEVTKTMTGASAAYLGMVDEEGLEGQPGPLLVYDRATAGSEFMKEKTLAQGSGVTWGAVTENPSEEVLHLYKPPVPEAPPADPESDEPPPEAPGLPYYPVYVECVTDVPEVNYFDLTRLGSYLAVPLVYTSYYTPEALAGAKAFEQEKIAEAAAREEKRKAAEEAKAAAEAAGEEPPPPAEEEPVEEKTMVLTGKTMKMVVCVDTLGTNTAIDIAKIVPALELCNAAAKCKEATETKKIVAQALKEIDETSKTSQQEEIDAAKAKAEEDLKAAMDEAEGALASDEESKKELVQKEYAYKRACAVAAAVKAMVLDLAALEVVPPEVLSTVAALCYVYAYPKESLYAKGKTTLSWDKVRTLIDDKLFAAMDKCEIAGAKKGLAPEHKLAAVKAMVPADLDEEKAKAISPAFELLLSLLQAAVAYRTQDLAVRKEDYNKKKEEEGEEFKDPPLEELDDDFVE